MVSRAKKRKNLVEMAKEVARLQVETRKQIAVEELRKYVAK